MPKMKTRRAAAKRFKLTGRGRIKRNNANHSHMLIRRSNSAKRKCVKQRSWIVLRRKEYAVCWAYKGGEKCQEQIVLSQGTDVIERSSSRPRATMVPGAALSSQQKKLYGRPGPMPIVIDARENAFSGACGSHESMRQPD